MGYFSRVPKSLRQTPLIDKHPCEQQRKAAIDRQPLARRDALFRASGPQVKCAASRITMVHNGVMRAEVKTVRQSISLPVKTATQVRTEAEKRKQQEFFDLAERFRSERDTEEAKRLGDQLGRMVFGG